MRLYWFMISVNYHHICVAVAVKQQKICPWMSIYRIYQVKWQLWKLTVRWFFALLCHLLTSFKTTKSEQRSTETARGWLKCVWGSDFLWNEQLDKLKIHHVPLIVSKNWVMVGEVSKIATRLNLNNWKSPFACNSVRCRVLENVGVLFSFPRKSDTKSQRSRRTRTIKIPPILSFAVIKHDCDKIEYFLNRKVVFDQSIFRFYKDFTLLLLKLPDVVQ